MEELVQIINGVTKVRGNTDSDPITYEFPVVYIVVYPDANRLEICHKISNVPTRNLYFDELSILDRKGANDAEGLADAYANEGAFFRASNDSGGVAQDLTYSAPNLTLSGGGSVDVRRFPNDIKSVITVNPALTQNIDGVSYISLEGAVAYANSTATLSENIIVQLGASVDLSVPIVITNPFVSIRGSGLFETTINVQDSLAGQQAITLNYPDLQTNSPIGSVNIIGTTLTETTAGSKGLAVQGQGVVYINDIRIQNFDIGLEIDRQIPGALFVFSKGFLSVRNAGSFGVRIANCQASFSDVELVESAVNLFADDGSQSTFQGGSFAGFTEPNIGTGLRIDSGANLALSNITFADLGVGADLNGGELTFIGCVFERNTIDATVNSVININTRGTEIDLSKINFNASANISGTFFNVQAGDDAFDVFKEFAVGSPNNGKESVFGQGDSYNTSAIFQSFDGVSFADVKNDVINIDDGNVYSFPNNSAGTALYISNIYPTRFLGLKVKVNRVADLGLGDWVFEYWDGLSWTEFNHMVSKSDVDYIPYANDKLTSVCGTGNFQLRFDERIFVDWQLNDPISSGQDRYWIRLRISSPITQSFEIDQIKLHTSRTELNADGFAEHFGNARPIKKFPITFGSFQAGASSPGNADIYISDTLFAGRAENRFDNGSLDRTGVAIIAPYDLDTSSPIKVRINAQGLGNGVDGDITWQIDWAGASENSLIATGTGAVPPSTPTQQTIIRSDSVISVDFYQRTKTFVFDLEIPLIIPQVQSGEGGNLLFITIARLGNDASDTYGSNVAINDISFEYTSWRSGGHVLAQ